MSLTDFKTSNTSSPQTTEAHSNSGEAWRRLADAHREKGNSADATVCYGLALQLNQKDGESLNGLGIVLAGNGDIEKAIAAFQQAISSSPSCAQYHHNLGVALAQSDLVTDSIESFKYALALQPDYAEAHLSLANALAAQSKCHEAVTAYKESLRFNPDSAPALNGLGLALTSLRRAGEAIPLFLQAVRIQPDYAGALNNLGLAFTDEGRYAEAECAFERALRLQPKYAEAHSNFGNVLKEQGRLGEAMICYDIAMGIAPGLQSARWNRSLALLQKGDFEIGWREYESRRYRKGAISARVWAQPEWDGSPLSGCTILLHTEQGLGDVVQFIRYAHLLKLNGATVIVESPSPLLHILSPSSMIDLVVIEGNSLPSFDFHLPVMSLPRLFNTQLDSVPANIPYLFADPHRVARFKDKLSPLTGLRIGVAWQGNPHHQWDRHRSVPLSVFARLAELKHVCLVSLQRGPGTEQMGEVQFPITQCLDPSAPDSEAVADCAALIKCLDMVITVDTLVAHLAGALGVTVWVILSTMVDWRWLLDRSDTPWYPTMKLFRQRERGKWAPVFEQMALELEGIF